MFNALPSSSSYRWTVYTDVQGNYVLPYIITGNFDDEELAIIQTAMKAIENNTCLRFQKRKNEKDYLDLQNERNQGCYTTVGRQSGKNVVMLEANALATCVEHDIVVHELMHTLGLWHEHMRADRDKFIKVHYENIETAYYSQFEKVPPSEATTYNITYDYRSVMHYAKDAFGKSSSVVTMETLDPKFQNVIGKVTDPAPSDYYKICSIYQCQRCINAPFNAQTIANFERQRNISLPTTTTQAPAPQPQFPSTRATRLPLKPITAPPPLLPITVGGQNSSDCKDRFFCPTILNAWNKDFMCRMKSVQTWCCLTCAGNSKSSVWFRFGVAD
uniref:Metalloendopeptidase n=1 Tax=Panagrolaimus sp. PS1159 TaxID=55785 RepID=A0AC35FMV6_9BILA